MKRPPLLVRIAGSPYPHSCSLSHTAIVIGWYEGNVSWWGSACRHWFRDRTMSGYWNDTSVQGIGSQRGTRWDLTSSLRRRKDALDAGCLSRGVFLLLAIPASIPHLQGHADRSSPETPMVGDTSSASQARPPQPDANADTSDGRDSQNRVWFRSNGMLAVRPRHHRVRRLRGTYRSMCSPIGSPEGSPSRE